MQNTWLLDFAANVYSQEGEDGIVQKALEILPARDRWCVEFGAWDGQHLSNTRNLIESHHYAAVLIEGSRPRFNRLQQKYSSNPAIWAVNRFVGVRAEDNLDHILSQTPIPADFDFLSIDIDGNDYHVWKAVAEYKPKVVCIEFNPTIPTEVRFVQAADPAVSQGSSLLSLTELGKSKGYELISVLPFNAFFVRSELYPLFQIDDNRPESLRKNLDFITYVFSGFDGTLHLQGNGKLPWHNLTLQAAHMQPLPKCLRRFPGNYNRLQQALFLLFLLVSDQAAFSRAVSKRKYSTLG